MESSEPRTNWLIQFFNFTRQPVPKPTFPPPHCSQDGFLMPLRSDPSPDRRRYDVACPIARALDQVGERWTLLILRELLPGPLRFSEIKSVIEGINATILSRRLDQMMAEGLVALAEIRGQTTGYAATPRAAALWPILLGLAAWGAQASPNPAAAFGITAAVAVTAFVALRPADAPRLPIGFTLLAPRLEWCPDQALPLRRGPGVAPLEIVTTPETLFALVTGTLSPSEALNRTLITLHGDAGAFLDHLPA